MPIGGPLATAIDQVWDSVRTRHPDVPEAVVSIASGSTGRGRSVRRGHFGPDRWEHRGQWLPELFIGAEGLAGGAREVLATLLHEAVHGIALTRDINAASDNGRYHNKKFKQLAEEIGLTAARHPHSGWSLTTLPDNTSTEYQREITILDHAIVAHRRPEHTAEDTDAATAADETEDEDTEDAAAAEPDRNGQPLTCQCQPPRRIRAHRKIIAAGPILCGVCQEPFSP
ncbi:hypothetical protein [Nocardia tengchongensis]|uniref:hypothetical protein n=1 Tax=Nocardia tengchongensis TaxID=2055889 RepID=UPI0036A33AE5